MKKCLLNRRYLMMIVAGVGPYLLGAVLMLFDVWVDPLALLPLVLIAVCVNFNTAKSTGQFLLLQVGQLVGILGYGGLCGRSYSRYLTGSWVPSDMMSFGTTVMVMLMLVLTGILAIKALRSGNGARTGVTAVLLSLSGITGFPALLIAFFWMLFSIL